MEPLYNRHFLLLQRYFSIPEVKSVLVTPFGQKLCPYHKGFIYCVPQPRSAENPSALSTGANAAAFIVPSVTAATTAMVTTKPQTWRNPGMKFISYTPTTVTTTVGMSCIYSGTSLDKPSELNSETRIIRIPVFWFDSLSRRYQ